LKRRLFGTISLIAVLLLIAFTGMVYADRLVKAEPEIQGLVTGTGMNVQGTVTETDSLAWTMNANGIPISGDDPILANYPWGSSGWHSYPLFLSWWATEISQHPNEHLQDVLNWYIEGNLVPSFTPDMQALKNWLQSQGSPLTPPLQDQEIQYTTTYNDQTMAVSGQSSFVKSMAISTADKLADQSNVKADTSMQFIAIDTGRAIRTEDILLDGAAQWTNTSSAILCPFASRVSPVIPAYCNIVQAGSSMDTTLTSVVTSANDRFVGTDSTFPVVLNYNINAEGLTIGSQSSPMIGSVSAFMKVHVQEARSNNTKTLVFNDIPASITLDPIRSEDLVYSETTSASGLVSKFSKSMSYQGGFNLI
jgi:hypothetical protein